jgi:ATP-binding cassette subfamily B protein
MATGTIHSEFQPPIDYNTKKSGPKRWILSHATRNWFFLVLVVLFQLISSYMSNVIPLIIGDIFGLFVDNSLTFELLTEKSTMILIYGVLIGVLVFLRNLATETVGQRLERDSRDELYSSLLGKSLTFHDGQQVGDIMSRVATDVRQLNFMINPGFNLVFASVASVIMTLFFISQISYKLLIVPFIFLIVFLVVLRRYNDNLSPVAMDSRRSVSMINSRLNESLTGMHVVRGSARETKEMNIFKTNIEAYRKAQTRLGSLQARYYPVLLLGIATAIGILHGISLYNIGEIGINDLVAFILLFFLLRFPIFINIFAITVMTMGVAAAKRILELLTGESLIDENLEGKQDIIRGEIKFDNVSFSYNGETKILQDISFSVKEGSVIAMIGMTGSGKTSITKLLSRLYDVDEGAIYVDGVNIKDWSINALRSQFSVVEQDIFLFSKTIFENITLGKDLSRDQVIEAAKLAHAHEFIENLPDGYDTEIGERGVTLSGGQRQRIAIARAIIREPRILILDDASSAIDSQTEDEINRAIRNVLKGRTSFIITHRVAQIRKANWIILLDEGKIIDQGTHDDLMNISVKYKEIFSIFDEEEI